MKYVKKYEDFNPANASKSERNVEKYISFCKDIGIDGEEIINFLKNNKILLWFNDYEWCDNFFSDTKKYLGEWYDDQSNKWRDSIVSKGGISKMSDATTWVKTQLYNYYKKME